MDVNKEYRAKISVKYNLAETIENISTLNIKQKKKNFLIIPESYVQFKSMKNFQ